MTAFINLLQLLDAPAFEKPQLSVRSTYGSIILLVFRPDGEALTFNYSSFITT